MTDPTSQIRGAFSAIFTPFDENNEVNYDMLHQIANFQMDHGVRGFFVCGSTGEGLLMTEEERQRVVASMVEIASGRATVIAHVGHPRTETSIKLAKRAADDGADWIASVAPIYHGTTFDGAMRHYQAISSATDLPFMVYSLGGVIEPLRDAAFFELPNVCGLKYTGSSFFSVQQLMRRVDRPVALMSGFDEQFVASLSFGFHGGIGSTFNFAPQFYSGIYNAYHRGQIEEAAQLQSKINTVTDLMIQYENWSYRKAIMKYLGFDCGAARLPYAPLTDQEFADYCRRLDALEVLKTKESTAV
ncbi:MAG: dihydrodipicolinate synthase family protein [Planctomycetota bacterium]